MREQERRRWLAEHVARFVVDVGKQHGPRNHEPNDRRYSPEFARRLRRMNPVEFDELVRGEYDLVDN